MDSNQPADRSISAAAIPAVLTGAPPQAIPGFAIFIDSTLAITLLRTWIAVNSLQLDTPEMPSFGITMIASSSMSPMTFILEPIGNVDKLVNEWNSVGTSFVEAVR